MGIGIIPILKVEHKYGEFTSEQLEQAQNELRKRIFFLLMVADPRNVAEYRHIDVQEAFINLMYRVNGLNSLLNYPSSFVMVFSMLEEARVLYMDTGGFKDKDQDEFKRYRKLILDCGNEVTKAIKED